MTIHDVLKTKTTAKDIIQDFCNITLVHEKEEIFTGDCFECGASKSGTKFRAFNSGFYCFGCGIKGDLVELIKRIKGIEKEEAFKLLLKEYAPEQQYSKKDLKNFEKIEQKEIKSKNYFLDGILYESLVEWGKQLLFEPEGSEALEYLVEKRSYKIENIKKSDFFYMPPIERCKKYLVAKHAGQKEYILGIWDKSKEKPVYTGLQFHGAYKEVFSLGIPYRDDDNIISGLIYRSIHPKGEKVTTFKKDSKTGKKIEKESVRYNSTKGLKKSSLFNIYKNRSASEILVVEGYPDATYLSTYPNINICAVGQGELGIPHINSLIRCNIQNLILSLDNDLVKDNDTNSESEIYYIRRRKIINALKNLASKEINTFIIDPDFLEDVKDIDEKYRKYGIKGVTEVISKKMNCIDYLVSLIQKQGDLKLKEGVTNSEYIHFLVDKYIDYSNLIPQNKHNDFKVHFVKIFSNASFTKKNIERLELLLKLQENLSEEELLSGLDRLASLEERNLEFLYNNYNLLQRIFSKKYHSIFKFICQQQEGEKLTVNLGKRGINRYEKIKQNTFLKLFSEKSLMTILLKSMHKQVFSYHEAQLKKSSTVAFASIDNYFKELEGLSKMCEIITKVIEKENK